MNTISEHISWQHESKDSRSNIRQCDGSLFQSALLSLADRHWLSRSRSRLIWLVFTSPFCLTHVCRRVRLPFMDDNLFVTSLSSLQHYHFPSVPGYYLCFAFWLHRDCFNKTPAGPKLHWIQDPKERWNIVMGWLQAGYQFQGIPQFENVLKPA